MGLILTLTLQPEFDPRIDAQKIVLTLTLCFLNLTLTLTSTTPIHLTLILTCSTYPQVPSPGWPFSILTCPRSPILAALLPCQSQRARSCNPKPSHNAGHGSRESEAL